MESRSKLDGSFIARKALNAIKFGSLSDFSLPPQGPLHLRKLRNSGIPRISRGYIIGSTMPSALGPVVIEIV